VPQHSGQKLYSSELEVNLSWSLQGLKRMLVRTLDIACRPRRFRDVRLDE